MRSRPLVAVLLGTDHHRFDRLVAYAESISARTEADWLVQYGYSNPPSGLPGTPMLSADDLEDVLHRARAVVTHGGPGLIMEARAAGHLPVVVPRDPAYGEHVDRHQLVFARRIARDGLIRVADTLEELEDALVRSLIADRADPVHATAPLYFSTRVGRLVDDLVQRHP